MRKQLIPRHPISGHTLRGSLYSVQRRANAVAAHHPTRDDMPLIFPGTRATNQTCCGGQVWRVSTGEEAFSFTVGDSGLAVMTVSFSPDGTCVLAGSAPPPLPTRNAEPWAACCECGGGVVRRLPPEKVHC